MRRLRPLVAWVSKSPICGTASIEAMLHSPRPTAASENRLSSGGVKMARATVVRRARSGPNQGLARAPSTDLRVVATNSVGRAAMSDVSNRGPFAARPAQPPTASAAAADARPRSAIRRETAMRTGGMRQSFLVRDMGTLDRAERRFLTCDRGDNRAGAVRPVLTDLELLSNDDD